MPKPPPKPIPTPIQTFLAPLAALARTRPEIEALVFWGGPTGWDAAPTEALPSDEITFWAEGLIEDGFHLLWTVVARAASPDEPDHIRLHVWQDPCPPPPGLPPGWHAVAARRWVP